MRKTEVDMFGSSLEQQALEAVRAMEEEMMSPETTDNPETEMQYYNMSRGIFNAIDRKFTLLNSDTCRGANVDILILVPSRPGSAHTRAAIRSTYGKLSSDRIAAVNNIQLTKVVRVLFLTGTTSNMTQLTWVHNENKNFQDVIETEVEDTYYNLTAKILHGLKWVTLNCPDVKFLVKADEDVFINVIELVRQLVKFESSDTDIVLGTIQARSKHTWVHRDGRWGVPYNVYPLTSYPPYAQGNCYILSGTLLPKIIETAPYFPYLHIEDAFITGILAGKLHHARLINLKRNARWLWYDVVPDPCKFVMFKYISSSNMSPHNMNTVWNILLHQNFTICDKKYHRVRQ